jgi:parallel beta-helix repeat protein
VGPNGAAAASEFVAVDDSYVDANKPDRNYGSRKSMHVHSDPMRVAYLKFDVIGAGSPESVALQINIESNATVVDLYHVPDSSWDEATLTHGNAPPLGTFIGSRSGVLSGSYYFDVSSVVTGDGLYSFALATTGSDQISVGTKEGGGPARLHIPAPPSPFLVTRTGTNYTAASPLSSYDGSLRSVVESAVSELGMHGGGTVTFAADTFDLGTDQFEFRGVADIVFEGQGMYATAITNDSSAAADSEPFDFVSVDRVTLRGFTVAANGPPRTTSDALDFDNGNDNLVDNVRITASRSRGIIFDGKGLGWTAVGNTVTNCVIEGVHGDGIELLAASWNTISGCSIGNVGGHGIQVNKASMSAPQANKKSTDNLITNTTIDQAGRDGINIISSDRTRVITNVVTNSADDVSNRDGIRIQSIGGISCDDNEIDLTTATDTQVVKTQRYGINISNVECNRTVIGEGNILDGNRLGEINDNGTNTQYPLDIEPPTVPTGVTAVASTHYEVDVAWAASTDNVGVTAYTVSRNGSAIAALDGSTLSFSDKTVAPLTTYEYTVEAFDAAGNPSGPSTPPSPVTTPPIGTITLEPTDDAYVDSARSTSNFGSRNALRIDGSPTKDGYLKFDVIGVFEPVTSVTLKIYPGTGSTVGLDVHAVTDTGWTEGAITYDTAPVIGAVLGSSGPFSAGSYLEIDVTGYVTGNGLWSFGVTTPHSAQLRLDSSEGTNAPELVIEQGA